MSQRSGVGTNEKEVNRQVTFSPSGTPYRVVVTGGGGDLRVEDLSTHQVNNNIEAASALVDQGFTVNGFQSGGECSLHYWKSNEQFPKRELTLMDFARFVCCCPAKKDTHPRPGILGYSGAIAQQPGYFYNSSDVGSEMSNGVVQSPYDRSPVSMRYTPGTRGGYN